MSPGISLLVALPDRRPPRARVLEALHASRALGTPLSMGPDAGVAVARFTGGWVLDRRRPVPGVNIVGALLLHLQPTATAGEDPSGILARELGVPLAFVEGCADGWGRETMSEFWLKGEREAYVSGFFLGHELLVYASLVCSECNSRRFKSQAKCDGCDR